MGVNTVEHDDQKQLAQFREHPLSQLLLTPRKGRSSSALCTTNHYKWPSILELPYY